MKPTLYLAGQNKGGPTPDHIFELYTKLTGKEPTQSEKDKIYMLHQAKMAESQSPSR